MTGMFSFLNMLDNYDDRAVAREERGELIVDTCRVSDGDHGYETAVQHPDYNDGLWVIVEAYDTEDHARTGHEKWVKIMTTEPLPNALTDCCNAMIGKLVGATVFSRVITQEATP